MGRLQSSCSGIGLAPLRGGSGRFERAYGAQCADCIAAASRYSRTRRPDPPSGARRLTLALRDHEKGRSRIERIPEAAKHSLAFAASNLGPQHHPAPDPRRPPGWPEPSGWADLDSPEYPRSGGNAIRYLPAIGGLNYPELYPQGARAYSGEARSARPPTQRFKQPRRGFAHPCAMLRNASARCLSFSARARSAESSSDSENRCSASESSAFSAPASRSSAGTTSSTSTRAVLS